MFFFLIVASCCENIETEPVPVITVSQEQIDLVKAKKIVEETCQVCHSATATMDDRLAPPLEAVKRRYLMTYPKIEDFTANLAAYVAQPTKEKALMKGAVDKFNLMTPLPLPEEDLKAVATYIYQFDLDKPEWFDAHYQEMHGKKGMGNGNGNRMRRGGGGGN